MSDTGREQIVTRPDTIEAVVVVGAGPAGLMAAEVLADAGCAVEVWDRKPSAARKFLLAGKGGLNLSHVEALDLSDGRCLARYGDAARWLAPALRAFDGSAIRDWARSLGIDTFVGSSGRVFPIDMKAAPLLRQWVARLRANGVRMHMRRRWTGFGPDGALCWEDDGANGLRTGAATAPAALLALGGASWPQLGSDGAWVPVLAADGVEIAPLAPANCGFDLAWSESFADRFAGEPVKSVCMSLACDDGRVDRRRGEFVVTRHGIEGSLVYAFSARLRDRLARGGPARVLLDLQPERDRDAIAARLAKLPPARSLAWRLKRAAAIDGVKAGLLREAAGGALPRAPDALAALIKAAPLAVLAPRPLAESISTAGGVSAQAIDGHYMLRARPGVFVAGEMLDWEAPTGGFLLGASLATGRASAAGLLDWLRPRGLPQR
ncbi:MAG: TIGR03862 family flavoprotein [Lautropia sp.]